MKNDSRHVCNCIYTFFEFTTDQEQDILSLLVLKLFDLHRLLRSVESQVFYKRGIYPTYEMILS